MRQSGKNITMFLITVAAVLALSPAAWAKPKVNITIKAEKEVVVIEQGTKVKRLMEATGVEPGEEILYTLNYRNTGDEAATNIVISDPIPSGTMYIPGSATDTGELTFSIDHGKTFKKSALLTYEVTNASGKMEKRVASPEAYTDIRWVIQSLPAGGKGSVNFKVKTK
jgi:uncharacterized repeat protein (TIGR01451 family)